MGILTKEEFEKTPEQVHKWCVGIIKAEYTEQYNLVYTFTEKGKTVTREQIFYGDNNMILSFSWYIKRLYVNHKLKLNELPNFKIKSINHSKREM